MGQSLSWRDWVKHSRMGCCFICSKMSMLSIWLVLSAIIIQFSLWKISSMIIRRNWGTLSSLYKNFTVWPKHGTWMCLGIFLSGKKAISCKACRNSKRFHEGAISVSIIFGGRFNLWLTCNKLAGGNLLVSKGKS